MSQEHIKRASCDGLLRVSHLKAFIRDIEALGIPDDTFIGVKQWQRETYLTAEAKEDEQT